MTLCPIAIVVTCKKCPAYTACPLKGVLGDYVKPEQTPSQAGASAAEKRE